MVYTKPTDGLGFCAAWCFFLAECRILNPDLPVRARALNCQASCLVKLRFSLVMCTHTASHAACSVTATPLARAYVQGTELMRRAVETLSGRAVPRPDDSVNDGSEDPLTLSGVLRGLGDATAARVYEAGRSYAMGLVQHRKPY